MLHLDTIGISGLEVDCVVGVHRHERDAPQLLHVDVALRLDTDPAGESQRISRTVDYQEVTAQIVFILQCGRFLLLETAARALARHLLAPPLPDEVRPEVACCEIRLSKPNALDGKAIPSLFITRDAKWARLPREEASHGSSDTIHRSAEVEIHRLNLAPGAKAPLSSPAEVGEAVMMLGDGLLCQGKASPLGSIHRWAPGERYACLNPTGMTQSILRVRAGSSSSQGASRRGADLTETG